MEQVFRQFSEKRSTITGVGQDEENDDHHADDVKNASHEQDWTFCYERHRNAASGTLFLGVLPISHICSARRIPDPSVGIRCAAQQSHFDRSRRHG